MNYSDKVYEILNSVDFSLKLEQISVTYPNLKQENVIRNLVLEIFNKKYSTDTIRAFAEHPRISKINLTNSSKTKERTDLSMVSTHDLENPFKIEFKFHYTKHSKAFLNYADTIIMQFIERKCSMFILIVVDMDIASKNSFDAIWGIDTHLEKYQSKGSNWKTNLENCFNDAAISTQTTYLKPVGIPVTKPYLITYNFYVLTK